MPSTVVVAVTDDGLSNTWTSAVQKKKIAKKKKSKHILYVRLFYIVTKWPVIKHSRFISIRIPFLLLYCEPHLLRCK